MPSRRTVLRWGLGGAAVATTALMAGAELVDHGVLPGRLVLDTLDGACDVTMPPLDWGTTGPTRSGSFYSRYRRRSVGWTMAWPPSHGPGDTLPLVVALHGFGGNHRATLAGMQPAQALALRVDGRPLAPMGLVTVDGGGGYWNPHPGDDPQGMVLHELLPMCRRVGLGRPPATVGTLGISMGGFGALLFGEVAPQTIRAVAAIAPAVWTSYAQARAANAGAFASAQAFAAADVVTRAGRLAATPVRVASGDADPFHPGVVTLAAALAPGAVVDFTSGCHTGPFFTSQEPASLAFLARHLAPG